MTLKEYQDQTKSMREIQENRLQKLQNLTSRMGDETAEGSEDLGAQFSFRCNQTSDQSNK